EDYFVLKPLSITAFEPAFQISGRCGILSQIWVGCALREKWNQPYCTIQRRITQFDGPILPEKFLSVKSTGASRTLFALRPLRKQTGLRSLIIPSARIFRSVFGSGGLITSDRPQLRVT